MWIGGCVLNSWTRCAVCCRALNALDVRLHERALELLEHKRQQLEVSGVLQQLPEAPPENSGCTADDGDEDTDLDDEDYEDETLTVHV